MIGWRSGACRCEAVTGPVERRSEVAGWDVVTTPLGGPRHFRGGIWLQSVRDGLWGKMDMGEACGGAWIGEIGRCVDNGKVVNDGGIS